MTENKKRLLEFLSQNEEARNRFDRLSGLEETEIIEKGISLAKEYGFDVTEEDLKSSAGETQQMTEIDDDELEGVAGGTTCVCVIGGGGSPKPCACVVTGLGHDTNSGKQICFCLMGGGGKSDAG